MCSGTCTGCSPVSVTRWNGGILTEGQLRAAGLTALGKNQRGFHLSTSFLCPEEPPGAPTSPSRFPASETLRAGSTEIRGFRKLHLPRVGAGMHVLGFVLKALPVNRFFPAVTAVLRSQTVLLAPIANFSHQGGFPSWEKTRLHKTKVRTESEGMGKESTAPLTISCQLRSNWTEILQKLFQTGAFPAPVASFPNSSIPSHCPAQPWGGGTLRRALFPSLAPPQRTRFSCGMRMSAASTSCPSRGSSTRAPATTSPPPPGTSAR